MYEALRPILNEMREDISSVKNERAKISQRVSNQTKEIDAKFSYMNESLRDDFSGVERELSGLNNTANMICDKTEEHENHIITELMRMNETLTEELINNRESIYDTAELKCGGTWGWRRAVYLDMTDPNTNCPSGWNMTGYTKRTCGRANSSHFSYMTQSSSLSVEDHTVRCVVGSEPTSIDCLMAFLGIMVVENYN